MKKRIVTIALVIALLATCFAGTYAYLTDIDSVANTMTLGNVQIKQNEYQRVVNADGTYATATVDNRTSYVLETYEDGKPLYPIVGDPNEPGDSPAFADWDSITVRMSQVGSYGGMQVFAGKNAQDKFVTVTNTGKTDAYVRTIVAIEVGSSTKALVGKADRGCDVDKAATDTAPWVRYEAGTIEIKGSKYRVIEYVYRGAETSSGWVHQNGVLPAEETTYPSFAQIYLKHNATNEDMTKLDGNGNGKLDILVLSQAVQTAGWDDAKTALDTAFGTVAANAATWLGDIA